MKNPAKMNHIEVLNHIGQLNRQSDLKSQEIKLLKQRIEQLEWELEGIQCVFANENDNPDDWVPLLEELRELGVVSI